MEYMDNIKKKACKALEDLGGSNDLELMKESHRTAVKDLMKIMVMADEMDDGAYSGAGYSERRHYVRGHYSRDGASMRNGRYSRTDAKREMLSHLESAMAAAPDDITRNMARDFYDKVDRA